MGKQRLRRLREAGAGSSNLLTPTNYFLINQVLNNPTIPCRGYLKSTCHNFATLVLARGQSDGIISEARIGPMAGPGSEKRLPNPDKILQNPIGRNPMGTVR